MSNSNSTIKNRYKAANKEIRRAYGRSVADAVDPSKLTMYDLTEDGHGAYSNVKQLYPDFNEADTFVVSGPVGPLAGGKGRSFDTFIAAFQHYTRLQGEEPVEVCRTPNTAARDKRRYMLKFRLPRSPELVADLVALRTEGQPSD